MTVEGGVLHTHVKLHLSNTRSKTLPALSMPWYWRSGRFMEGVEMLDQASQQAGGPSVTRKTPNHALLTAVMSVVLSSSALAVNEPWNWFVADNYSSAPNACAVLTEGPAAPSTRWMGT